MQKEKQFLSFFVFGVVFLLFLATNSFSQDTELTKMLVRVKPAVVLIYVQVSGEVTLNTEEGPQKFPPVEISATGSGFIIHPRGYLVTNGHVVQLYYENNEEQLRDFFLRKVLLQTFIGPEAQNLPKGQLEQRLNNLVEQFKKRSQVIIKKDLKVILSNKQVFSAEIKAYSPPIQPQPGKLSVPGYHYKAEAGKDISILKIENKDLPIVYLGDSDLVQLGEPIYIVGYPGAVISHPYLTPQIEPTVTTGTISGTKLDIKGMPVIQTDAAVTWGNSGGPAFNKRGEVIGVATFGSIAQGQAIQGFNFLVPINTVKEFIRASGVPLGEGSIFNKLWEEALNLYYEGKFKEALEKLEEVNRIHKDFPDVVKLQKQIQKLIVNKEEAEKNNLLPYILAILGLAAVGAGLYIWKSKKKEEPVVEPPKAETKVVSTEVYGILVGESGPIAGKVFKIGPKGVKIGRDPNKNDIVIKDDRISREHAWVGPEGNNIVVKDLDSSNGTFINNTETRITKHILKEGDVIILGKGNFASLKFKKA